MTKQVVKQTVEDKLVDMLDALQNGVVHVGDQALKYSPDIADTALWIVRIDGAETLLYGAIALVASLLSWKHLVRLWAWARKEEEEACSTGGFYLVAILGSSPFLLLWISVVEWLFGVWNWIAVFAPKLYLAKQIIKSVLP